MSRTTPREERTAPGNRGSEHSRIFRVDALGSGGLESTESRAVSITRLDRTERVLLSGCPCLLAVLRTATRPKETVLLSELLTDRLRSLDRSLAVRIVRALFREALLSGART